jgi:hypothetical protein
MTSCWHWRHMVASDLVPQATNLAGLTRGRNVTKSPITEAEARLDGEPTPKGS